MLSPDSLPPNAITLRDDEYEDDQIAVRFVTYDKSCLTKLSGGNLACPSHSWEFWGMQLPAMSLRERVAELRRRTAVDTTLHRL